MNGMEEDIKQKLIAALNPLEIQVINDSHRHRGHGGDDGSGQTHFSVMIVSSLFVGQSRLERHRMVYSCLDTILGGRIHALSIKALAPDEPR